jgi:hypothetical protein
MGGVGDVKGRRKVKYVCVYSQNYDDPHMHLHSHAHSARDVDNARRFTNKASALHIADPVPTPRHHSNHYTWRLSG